MAIETLTAQHRLEDRFTKAHREIVTTLDTYGGLNAGQVKQFSSLRFSEETIAQMMDDLRDAGVLTKSESAPNYSLPTDLDAPVAIRIRK